MVPEDYECGVGGEGLVLCWGVGGGAEGPSRRKLRRRRGTCHSAPCVARAHSAPRPGATPGDARTRPPDPEARPPPRGYSLFTSARQHLQDRSTAPQSKIEMTMIVAVRYFLSRHSLKSFITGRPRRWGARTPRGRGVNRAWVAALAAAKSAAEMGRGGGTGCSCPGPVSGGVSMRTGAVRLSSRSRRWWLRGSGRRYIHGNRPGLHLRSHGTTATPCSRGDIIEMGRSFPGNTRSGSDSCSLSSVLASALARISLIHGLVYPPWGRGTEGAGAAREGTCKGMGAGVA